MTFVKISPFVSISALQDRINEAFVDAFSMVRKEGADCMWNPVVDIFQTSSAIVMTVELPGVRKNEIYIDVKDNILTLNGEKAADPQIREERYYCRERRFGAFHRSFTFPYIIDPDAITAAFKNGLLEIHISQPVEDKPKKIMVDID